MREKPRDEGRLKHILHAIDNIERFITDKSRDDFTYESLLYYGVVKNLEIIGEASYMLSEDFLISHPSTPWRQIIGMRHFLVHGYYHVDVDEVWNTVTRNIPQLKPQIERYLEEFDKG